MKKLVCMLISLAMLCSLVVVNVSAANVYEGEGFRIVTEYELDGMLIDGGEPEYGWAYEYYLNGEDGYISIGVFSTDEGAYSEVNIENVFASNNSFQGLPASITENIYSDYSTYIVETFTENYLYELRGSAKDDYSYAIVKEIINNIELTDLIYGETDTENNPTEDDSESSTYWENEYFTIDSEVELTLHSESYEDEECYYYYICDDNGEWLGEIEVLIQQGDEAEELYNENLGYMNEDCTDVKEVKIGGLTGTQADDNGEEYLNRNIIIFNEDIFYYIAVVGLADYEAEFDILCDIVEKDLHFNNAHEEDEQSEDKTDKDSKEEKADEKTSNDNTTIIIVAIVCGTVLILGVTAIVVLGKKKKQ